MRCFEEAGRFRRSEDEMNTAFVTALCNGDGYAPGVEALGRSLEASGTRHARYLLVTADVPREVRARLAQVGWELRDVAPLSNPNAETLQLFTRFANVFTKLRVWELTELDKAVFLDADTIVLRNVDDLFDRPAFAAAPDFFLPDRFNSGVMVIQPSQEEFARMLDSLFRFPSYDGGDQGFLNSFIPNWYAMPPDHRLPAGYNMQQFIYEFLHAHPSIAAQIEKEVRIIHYSVQKPWMAKMTLTGGSEPWWEMYFEARPEKAAAWKRWMHSAEDWAFDTLVTKLLG